MPDDKRALWDIWQDTEDAAGGYPWRMQMIDYVGWFATCDMAEKYRDSVVEYRRRLDDAARPNPPHARLV